MTTTGQEVCARCGEALPKDRPEGWHRFGIGLHRWTEHHTLRWFHWRFQWLPEDPSDQVRATYTALDLCRGCAADVLLYAQGKPPITNPSGTH